MMSAKVIIKETTMVRPVDRESPKGTLSLSSLDKFLFSPSHHISNLYVYYYCPDSTISRNKVNLTFFDSAILKESLAKVLVPFYPMAGRFKTQGNDNIDGPCEIDCNGEGVLFTEAEIKTHSIADFGDFTPTPELKSLLIPSCDYSKGLSSFPLHMVQLTRFSCGGVTLGFANNHHVSDGYGYINMVKSWSRLARGLHLDFIPVHDRTTYLSPRNPPQIKFKHSEYDPPKQLRLGDCRLSVTLGEESQTQSSTFKFSKEQVNVLKEKATHASEVARLSTFEVLAGHIWRTVCMSRGLADDQEVRLYIPTDGRLSLALPEGYCGNVVFLPACIAKSGEITRNPLWYVACKIHETMEIVKNEDYLRSSIDYLDTRPNIKSFVDGDARTLSYPNMMINMWSKFPFYEADFGWGRPAYAGNGGVARDGLSYITLSPGEDGGYTLCLSLLAPHMALFKKYMKTEVKQLIKARI